MPVFVMNKTLATFNERRIVMHLPLSKGLISLNALLAACFLFAAGSVTFSPLFASSGGIIGYNNNDVTTTDYISDATGCYINACRFQATANLSVTVIKARVRGITGKYKCAIYSDNSGTPQNLLKESAEVVNPTNGWQSFSLPSAQAITSGSYYWLAIWCDQKSTSAGIFADLSCGTLRWSNPTPYGAYPNPISAPNSGVTKYCIYAEDLGAPPANSVNLNGTAFGTSPAFAAGREYDKAFDNNVETFFDYAYGDAGYTGIDLGSGNAKKVTYVRFYPRKGYEGRMNCGKFQGSNTSATSGFTDLYAISSIPPAAGWNQVAITNTTAYRWIRYYGPSGSFGNVAEIQFYSDVCPALSAPALSSPANAATGQAPSLSLSWAAVNGATAYRCQVATSSAFSTIVDDGTIAATAKPVNGLRAGTTYYWRVAACNICGQGAWSSARSFSTGNVIWAVNCGGPAFSGADGIGYGADAGFSAGNTYSTTDAISGTNNGTLYQSSRWYPGSFTYKKPLTNGTYNVTLKLAEIYFTSAGSRKFNVLIEGVQKLTNFDIYARAGHDVAFDTTFPVTVSDGALAICFSQGTIDNPKISAILATSASAVTPPAAPTLASPANGATGQPTSLTLSWNASSGASSYRCQVSTSSSFSSTIVDDATLTATSKAVSGLAQGTTYYWRVKATNAGGTSAWSSVYNFKTMAVPTAPANLAVTSKSNTSISLIWSPSTGGTGAISYDIYRNSAKIGSTTATTYTDNGLTAYTSYSYYVKAVDGAGQSSAASNTISVSTSYKFLVIVSNPLYMTGLITSNLNGYLNDVKAAGYPATMITVNNVSDGSASVVCATPLALKSAIKGYYKLGYEGFVLIGSAPAIPTPLWEENSDDNPTNPTDLFYADTSAWSDADGDGAYETYVYNASIGTRTFVGQNYLPRMFWGRISAGGLVNGDLTQEGGLINTYLARLHTFRTQGSSLDAAAQNRSILITDDAWSGNHRDYAQFVSPFLPKLLDIYDTRITNRDKLIEGLTAGSQFMQLSFHAGGSDGLAIDTWDQATNTTQSYIAFTAADLDAIAVKSHYITLSSCGGCDYRGPNLGAGFLFKSPYMLNVAGLTNSFGIWADSDYYIRLTSQNAGLAMKQFILNNISSSAGESPRSVGFIMLGDPIVQYAKPARNDKTP
jgi:hypothetical protein